MANIQIGKYDRPGIFIEEFDESVRVTPTVEGITNLVIGSSKKGPFNTLVRLTSIKQLEEIYGKLDRSLERKGSFFHRTVSKMLEISPVFALNLLPTNDELDKVEFKSLSASSEYNNSIKKESPYRRMFDTTGLWKKDTESFLNVAGDAINENVISLTNLSSKQISAFIFKSKKTGFDRPLVQWYGSEDKVPPYVNGDDYASDYLVDVIIVSGDWSNYKDLSVNSRWNKYFNSTGLRKDQVRNFANDSNVNTLSFYEGLSLIPFFRDLNGRNIFIEDNINRDTDLTGLFCAFNIDAIEDDFYNGKIDLLGQTIADTNEKNIEFLSYKETISENIKLENKPLDMPGNVLAILGNGYDSQLDHSFADSGTTASAINIPKEEGFITNDNRTAWFAEDHIYNVKSDNNNFTFGNDIIPLKYNIEENSFAVIGGEKVDLNSGDVTLNIELSYYPNIGQYTATAVLTRNGTIELKQTKVKNTKPSVSVNDIVLGYATFEVVEDPEKKFSDSADYFNVSIDDTGFNDLQLNDDFQITNVNGDGNIRIEFLGTNNPQDTSDYEAFRKYKHFNRLLNLLDGPNLNKCALMVGNNKHLLENAMISDIVNSDSENKSFVLETKLNYPDLANSIGNNLIIYKLDDEVIFGKNGLKTKNENAELTDMGVVSKYSTLYNRFFDGIINTKDFLYTNRLYVNSSGLSNDLLGESVSVEFIKIEGKDYLIFGSNDDSFDDQVDLLNAEKIKFPQSSLNNSEITIINDQTNNDTPTEVADSLGYTSGQNNYFYAYLINENINDEKIDNVDIIYDIRNKIYLKMYVDGNKNMNIHFVDETLNSTKEINIASNKILNVKSRRTNFKQTVEVELPDGYDREPNKILVDGSRYTELKIGDFLETDIDLNKELELGEKQRKMTRVLTKRQYVGDPRLMEITCDNRIKLHNFNGDYQTMRFVGIDNYANSYKAVSLRGFRPRKNSLPDGTEEKQNEILNLIAKGTPLFRSLSNKESIDFRYLIDSFGLGLTANSKRQLVDLCGERFDAFGFINMPSLKSFKNSSSPKFTNSEGVLQTSLIRQGGDLESNPAFLYSFASSEGQTSVGYFTPYLRVNDGGRGINVPPASFVASTYMRKHTSNISSKTAWTIAAGITDGRVNNIAGVEEDFDNQDISNLNLAMMNPIVFKKNRGFIIETENTAQTTFNSALSYIHVREVLIELERELSRMLLDYQWKFNTADVRAEIKLNADTICEKYVNQNGLYTFFNKIDDENNTNEIIDNQIGVLDTYVEPIRGMGVIVNNITILRTGAISAGGFINS